MSRVVHTLKYTKARRGGMILKVDFEKAYDMMEWSFVQDTLRDAGIPVNIIEVIMKMLQKSSSRLLWNWEVTKRIFHSRASDREAPSPRICSYCVWSI